jgi:hypothetical protein
MTTATAEKQEYVDATSAEELFNKISGLLSEAGHQNPTAWIDAMVANFGPQVRHEQPTIARAAANSHWRYILGIHGVRNNVDTSNARFCIEDMCKEYEWYKLMKQIVVPAIIQCGL